MNIGIKLTKTHNLLIYNAYSLTLSSAQCDIQNTPSQLSVNVKYSNMIMFTKHKSKQIIYNAKHFIILIICSSFFISPSSTP